MLASGAHVKIGAHEFFLEEGLEGHYRHSFETVFIPRQDVSGKPGKQNVRPDIQFWSHDDWSGGEGEKFFDPQDPVVYDTSTDANPRIAGQLTARPTKTTVVVAASF